MRATVIQGIELPRDSGIIQVSMGPYLLVSKHQSVDSNGCCRWLESIAERKVIFPYDDAHIDQLPDIIVYFNSGTQ